MSDEKICIAFPQRVVLQAESKNNGPSKFIKEKQQLESVLGPSNPNWLEDATRRKQQQSMPVVRSYESVVDSPLLTPRISQICRDELQVGSTPDGSSYSPQTVNRILGYFPCGSTPDTLLKPVLGNSPCLVSPISVLQGKSQPCATLAHSLGANVEESALNWTNSLATPPGDMSLSNGKLPVDSGKTKDLARALFTPTKKLDISCDSVNPLDSTCESCDLSADLGLANQSVEDEDQCNLKEGDSKENESASGNDLGVNLADTKKIVAEVFNSPSPKLEKDTLKHKAETITCTDNVNTTPSANSSQEKLQALSPLQNLVNSDLRPLNTSLNESADSVKILDNKCKLTKAELRENITERDVDSKELDCHFDTTSSPVVSAATEENTDKRITSPTFSQKSARKRNRIVSETSPTCSPRFSIDCALSDFFDPPSSAVGRRKRAPKKRKSTEMDTSSEFDVSDISIKCSTPKENVRLHSILSSKKKDKKSSAKKVRFSDAVLTKKVTFNLETEEVIGGLKNSSHESLDTKEEEKINVESSDQLRNDRNIFKVKRIIQDEKMLNDENLRDVHNGDNEVDKLQTSDTKDKQMPVKSNAKENLTYCKRRGLKMRSNKECLHDQNKEMPPETCVIVKTAATTVDENVAGVNDSETKNASVRSSEDSEAFSQVSPSALIEMCDIAQNVSGIGSIQRDIDKKMTSSRNNYPNKNSARCEAMMPNSHPLTENKIIAQEPKKTVNSSLTVYPNKPVFKNKQTILTAPRKFFYPSSGEISASGTKKVFQYKHESDKAENAGLVKSVSVKDIIVKPEKSAEKQEDGEKLVDAEKRKETDKRKASNRQKNEEKKKAGEKLKNAEKLADAEPQMMRNDHIKAETVVDDHADQIDIYGCTKFPEIVKDSAKIKVSGANHQRSFTKILPDTISAAGFKTGSGKDIKVDTQALLKAKQLMNEENNTADQSVKLGTESSFKGFQSASGSRIKLNDSALRKAEKLMNDDFKHVSNNNTSRITVSNESIQKAQKLISNVIVSPKENKLSQNMIGNGLAPNNDVKVKGIDNMEENEHDYEFSQWFDDEMEKETNMLEELAKTELCSFQTDVENVSNDSKMYIDSKTQKDTHILECKQEVKGETSIPEMEIRKEIPMAKQVGFSTAAGKNIKLSETAMLTAENLLFGAMNANNDRSENGFSNDFDKIDATGDCHKLVSPSVHNANISGNNVGFTTASGKMLHISENVIKKASSLVENCFDEKETIILDFKGKDVRKSAINTKDCVKPPDLAKGNKLESKNSLFESFKKEFGVPLAETGSLEEELSALTSLKSNTSNQTRKYLEDKKMHNGFQGFTSASGKIFKISDASLKKAESLISCDIADNMADKPLNVKEHEINVKLCSKNDFDDNSKEDTPHQGSDKTSIEEEIDALMSRKKSRSKPSNITSAVARDDKKNSRFPPGSNVPKGFRPFKAPRIMKSMKEGDLKIKHGKGIELDDRLYDVNLTDPDKQFDIGMNKKLSTTNEMKNRVGNTENDHEVKDASCRISTDKLNSNDNLNYIDKKVEHGKLEGEKPESDIQDCYSGLLSQMFADDMEADEMTDDPVKINDLDKQNSNTVLVEEFKQKGHGEILENQSDNLISNLKEKKRNKITESKSIDDGNKFEEENSKVENILNIKYGGFSTASGKTLDIKAEALSKAISILDDSNAVSQHRQGDTVLLKGVDSSGDGIVPDLERNRVAVEVKDHKTQSNILKPNMSTSKTPCMFKSASGKQLDVMDEELTAAKRTFDDFDAKSKESAVKKDRPQEVPEIETININKISNGCKIQIVNHSKSNSEKSKSPEVQNDSLLYMNEGSDKYVNVSEAFLNVANDNFTDVNKEHNPVTTAGSCLFQTASGKNIAVSEASLKQAEDRLQDSELHSGLMDRKNEYFSSFQGSNLSGTKSVCGSLFQTASGKYITVSEEALKNGRSRFKDSDLQVLQVNEEDNPSPTENDKNVTNCNKALKKTMKYSEVIYKPSENSESKGGLLFLTASGKDVAVSDKALEAARKNLESTDSLNDDIATDCLFQTASGKSVTVSDNALKMARKNLDDINEKNTMLESEYHLSLFDSTNDKTIPEQTMEKAKDNVDISKTDIREPKVSYRSVFQTASGKIVNVSREALEKVEDHFKDYENEIEVTKYHEDVSSGGKNMDVETLQVRSESLNISDVALEREGNSGGCMFQTASGKNVKISEDALKAAKETLNDSETNTEMPKIYDNSLFQTASGKSVSVSENTLKEIKRKWTDSDVDFSRTIPQYSSSTMFQTASGKSVSVSENALKEIKDNWTYSDVDFNQTIPQYSSSSMFQTASGKSVSVSEKALKVARDNFKETETHCLSNSKENSSTELFKSQKEASGCREGSTLFQTASGKNVTVSEKAIMAARESFRDSDSSHTNIEKEVKAPEIAYVNQANKRNSNQMEHSLFQTASGKDVSVSENALKVARDSLRDSELDLMTSQIKFPSNAGSLFQTASGRHVNVSEKALKFARESLKDTESNTVSEDGQLNKIMETCSNNQNIKRSSNVLGSLFQTASGKTVNVSEKALRFARDSLKDAESERRFNSFEDNPTSDQKVTPPSVGSGSLFQTARGKHVNVSEKALKFARDSLKDTEAEVVDNSFEKQSSRCQNVIRPASMKFSGSLFQTASGKNVEVSDTALSKARTALDSENKSCQELISPANRPKNQDIDSGFNSSEHLSTSLEALSSMKQKMYESRAGTASAKRGKSEYDETEQDGTPVKRRRVDMEEGIRGLQSRRSPFRSEPEDRRLATSRGFRPVRSRTLFKPPARIALNDLTKDINSCSMKNTPTKSSFQTPYKTTATKTPESTAQSTAKVVVHAPVFMSKTNDNKIGKEMTTSLKNTHGANSKDSQHSDKAMSFLGNRTPLEKVGHRGDRNEKENLVKVKQIQNVDGRSKLVADEKAMDSSSVENEKVEDSKNIETGNKDIKGDYLTEETEAIKDGNTFDEGIDGCTQNDDAEIFYCNLVEARKHQEDLIKHKQNMKVQPVEGRLYRQKQSSGRWKLRDFVRVLRQGCRQNVSKPAAVTASTAKDYKFQLRDFYGDDVTHVLVGDGAYLVPDDGGAVGRQEFYSAFLTMDGVDPKLISDVWVDNHYRWIVWKLAAYEVVCPSNNIGRYMTPEIVMLQLKYRYDREIDLCERSALKKIFERDDAPGKRMVLCVSNIIIAAQTNKAGNQENMSHDLDSKVLLELTDSWYSIKAQVDVPLTDLVRQGQITVGQKLCVSGAELVGAEDACSPLEAPDSIMLKICCNSCRPAPWDSKLGYQSDPHPLCVPLTGLRGEGGTVGVMDLIIVRKYPIMYMEKLPGGGCVFRASRAEEKVQQTFQSKQQENMEKLYRKIEQEMEREEKQEKQSISKKKWSRSEVEHLQSGREIHEALTASRQPDMIESLLTDRQIGKLIDYKRQLYDEKQQELNSRFQAAWQDQDHGGVTVRNVTPVLKFRVAGCAYRDMDNKITTILTVWRPAPEICDLEEGKRYKVYSLNTSSARSKYVGHDVQLTATKQTKFLLMNVDENFLDSIYEPREVLWASDISRRQPPYGEVDFVGVIVQVSQPAVESFSRQPDTVYCADCQGNLIAIKFWQGIKKLGISALGCEKYIGCLCLQSKCYDDGLLAVGNIICCSNLVDKAPYRARQLPSVEASTEFTHITNKPQNTGQRQALARLTTVYQDKTAFLERATTLLADLLEKKQHYRTTPEKRKYSTGRSFSDCEITPKKTANPVNHQKVVSMETAADPDLSMSIDSSFEEEICKADLDKVIADQGNIPPVKDRKIDGHSVSHGSSINDSIQEKGVKNVTEIPDESSNLVTSEKNKVSVENEKVNSDMSVEGANMDQGLSDALSGNDSSQTGALKDHPSHTHALLSDGEGRCKSLIDHDQHEVNISAETDQENVSETKLTASESQISSANNENTKTPKSSPLEKMELSRSYENMDGDHSNHSAQIRSPEDQSIVLPVNCQTPRVHRTRGSNNRLVSTGTKNIQTPSNQSHLVRSPEEELIAKLTPQTPNSQHSVSGLTPQTPSSQEGRAVYQAKMARLLSYGSPNPLTPIRTPVSRTVTKGFKPPSFVKK